MALDGRGWELHVLRTGSQRRSNQTRTIGRYQVFHDGIARPELAGFTAEPGGPGTNHVADCGLCVEDGVYGLATQDGDSYCSTGYVAHPDHRVLRKPAIQLRSTGLRTDILVHPGHGLLASLGCLNPTSELASGDDDIDFDDSRERVIAMLLDLRTYTAGDFPLGNGQDIERAQVVITSLAA